MCMDECTSLHLRRSSAKPVDLNVLREIALQEIEERVLTETGDGGDSDEEGLEIDFHNEAVRPRVKLGVPNDDWDTENLDVEYIDDSIGEAWWHMRALGAQIPGLPDSWMPPKELDNWGGYVPKIGSGAPLVDEINNPGGWNLYSLTPKYEKGKYISHQTLAGAIVVPANSDGERVVGNWKFHYNGWWPSEFNRNTYMGESAKNGAMKPKDQMGCLDVDVLKKHGLNAKHVKNNPMFFLTMLCPICLPTAIHRERSVSVNGIKGDTQTPYYSSLVQFTNVYVTMSESGAGGLSHGWKPTTIDEIVHWSGVAICHGSLDGRPHTIHAC